MKQRLVHYISAIATLLSLILLPIGTSIASKTLDRTPDPVVVRGDLLASAHRIEIRRLALLGCDSDRWRPVPFQIDERLHDRYVLQSGPEAEADIDWGRFDADDEIAFMVADTGPRCTGLPFPKDVENIQEIEVQDPVDGSRAYVYLAVYPDTAPRSGTDYVTYNVEKNLIETTDYTIGYHAEAPISISRLAVPRRAGGSGQSVADRQKIRARAVTVWNILTISKNENDFRAEILAYTDGPVRVVRRTRNWVRLFGRVPSPSVELTSVYWKTGMQFPLKIRVPFRVPRFFEEAGLRVYVDTPPDVPGRKFYNAHNRQGMLIDGRMSEAERHVDTTPSDWQVVAGTRPEHREGWFSRQVMIDAPQSVSMPLYYLDDASTPDEPERYPGCFGCLGFELDGLDELEKGDYTILVQMFPLLSYRPGDEKAFLDIYDRPLVVRTKVLAKP